MAYPLAELKTLIDSDPANSGKSDGAVLTWLREGVTKPGFISTKRINGWAASSNILGRWETATISGMTDGERGLSRALLNVVRYQDGVNLNDPEAIAQIDAAVALNLITLNERTALEAMASITKPRWAWEEGMSAPRLGHVIAARAL